MGDRIIMAKAKQFSAACIVDQYGNEVTDLAFISNIGEKTDFVGIPYESGDNSLMAYLNTLYAHIHGESFVYPDHADAVTATAAAAAWAETGTLVEIIPANTIESAFDIHWINISGISENSEIQVDLYAGESGSEVLIGSVPAVRNAVQSQEGSAKVQIPQQPANTRITARLSSSTTNATTANIKVVGHNY